MNRRTFLGTAALGGVSGLAGCFGIGGNNETPTEDTDGYPPESAIESTPEQRNVDTSKFGTTSARGVQVPLVPLDVAHYWYQRREARFADARGQSQYDRSRILGAVLSPAPDGGQDDPVKNWPKKDRVVVYCGCPHHLSSIRAAIMYAHDFDDVYVIDEGFWAWFEAGYPLAGSEVTDQPELFVVEGKTDPAHAGEMVWARHRPSEQQEAAPVQSDGSYTLEIRFADVTADTVISLATPTREFEAPLSELAAGVVTD